MSISNSISQLYGKEGTLAFGPMSIALVGPLLRTHKRVQCIQTSNRKKFLHFAKCALSNSTEALYPTNET